MDVAIEIGLNATTSIYILRSGAVVARQAHNLEGISSILISATKHGFLHKFVFNECTLVEFKIGWDAILKLQIIKISIGGSSPLFPTKIKFT